MDVRGQNNVKVVDKGFSFSFYEKELRKYKTLSKEEEYKLLCDYKNNNNINSKNKLVLHNLPFVISVARLYITKGVTLEDLVNEGNIGLIKGIENYDLSTNLRLITYAVHWIKQSILLYIYSNNNLIYIPIGKTKVLNRLNKLKQRIELEKERNITYKDILEHEEVKRIIESSKTSKEELNDILTLNYNYNSIYDETDSSSDSTMKYLDILEDDTFVNTDENDDKLDFKYNLELVMSEMEPIEKNIIKLIYGIGYNKSFRLEEISDIYNMTKERIRQIKHTAIRKMRDSKNLYKLDF